MSRLADKVVQKIRELGIARAAEFFEVTPLLVSQWEKGSKSVSLAAVERVHAGETSHQLVTNAAWEGKSVMVCLPWYQQAHAHTAIGLLSIYERAKMTVCLNQGNSFIPHARNRLAEQFLASGLEWSFWLDSDVIIPTGNPAWFNQVTGFNFPDKFAGLHTLNRLLSHNKTLVGGFYFSRTVNGKPTYAQGCDDSGERVMCRRGPRDELLPTKWLATGCLLVHRSVFEAITARKPYLKNFWFSHAEPDRMAFGEDVLFCTRSLESGHQPYVDLGLVCGHVGDTVYGPFNTHE